jgi:hypothetical protein
MDSSSLQYILKLKEFNCHFSNLELIGLSMCSKKIRELLEPSIYKSLDLINFIGNNKYKGGIISRGCEEYSEADPLFAQSSAMEDDDTEDDFEDEYTSFIRNPYSPLTKDYIASRNKMQSDLKNLLSKPKKLKLDGAKGYDYLVYGLHIAFSNISILSITFSVLKLEIFQSLLDNLVHLKDLKLSNSVLIKHIKGFNGYSINWPSNLKKLKIEDNEFGLIADNEDYIKSNVAGYPQTDIDNLELTPKHLSGLHTLALGPEFLSGYHRVDNDDQFLAFLRLNPQVENLKICFHQFKPEILEIISNFRNLTKLELSVCDFDDIEAFNAIKVPKLSSLKHLELTLIGDTSIFNAIIRQFPNLTYLSYRREGLGYNYETLYDPCLEKLESLKTLKLHILQFNPPENLNLPKLKNLESLEIYSGKFFNLNLLTTNSDFYPKLKLIKFTTIQRGAGFDQPEIGRKLKSHCKFLYFPYTLAFYKLDK